MRGLEVARLDFLAYRRVFESEGFPSGNLRNRRRFLILSKKSAPKSAAGFLKTIFWAPYLTVYRIIDSSRYRRPDCCAVWTPGCRVKCDLRTPTPLSYGFTHHPGGRKASAFTAHGSPAVPCTMTRQDHREAGEQGCGVLRACTIATQGHAKAHRRHRCSNSDAPCP